MRTGVDFTLVWNYGGTDGVITGTPHCLGYVIIIYLGYLRRWILLRFVGLQWPSKLITNWHALLDVKNNSRPLFQSAFNIYVVFSASITNISFTQPPQSVLSTKTRWSFGSDNLGVPTDTKADHVSEVT